MEQVVVHLINSYDKFTQFGNLSVLKYSTELKSYLNQGGALLMENQFYLYVQIHNERR